MAERLDDRDLEGTLSDIGARLGGPKRDLWPAVRTRIAEHHAKPWWSRVLLDRGALAPVAATLAIILVAGLLLTPSFADALGHLPSIPGLQIYRVRQSPTARPNASPLPSPTRSASRATRSFGRTVASRIASKLRSVLRRLSASPRASARELPAGRVVRKVMRRLVATAVLSAILAAACGSAGQDQSQMGSPSAAVVRTNDALVLGAPEGTRVID